MGTSPIRFLERKSVGGNILGRWTINSRNSSPYIKLFILSKYWLHPVQDNQYPILHIDGFRKETLKFLGEINLKILVMQTLPTLTLRINFALCPLSGSSGPTEDVCSVASRALQNDVRTRQEVACGDFRWVVGVADSYACAVLLISTLAHTAQGQVGGGEVY